MTDPYTVTPTTHPDSPERWQSAYARALKNELTIRPGLFGVTLWTVTSKSRPDLCHATDGVRCSCPSGEHGDPVCQHRALYRYVTSGAAAEVAVPIPANVRFLVRRGEPRPAA